MSTSLQSLYNGYASQSLLSELRSLNTTNSSSLSTSAGSTATQTSDSGHLSPFAQLLSELQQLEGNDPTKYQQVTAQIATKLQTAAQTAKTDGDTDIATELSQLATDFTKASTSNQLPNVQDLAEALSEGPGGPQGMQAYGPPPPPPPDQADGSDSFSPAGADSSNPVSTNGVGTSGSSSTGSALDSAAFDPMQIILSTLYNVNTTSGS